MKNLYVFDFHGVLEKGTENAVRIISNMALESKNYSYRMSKKDAIKFYGFKWGKLFEEALKISKSQADELYEECKRIEDLNPGIITKYTKQNDNASKVLDEIIRQKQEYILISNTEPKALIGFIKSASLEKYFTENNTFAVNKHENGQPLNKEIVLERFLAQKSYGKIIIIGDSPDDIKLKNVSPDNSVTFLYTHPGLNFKECAPDYRIRDLKKILNI